MTKNNFLIKIITLLLITSVSLFAVDEIITWGYGRQLHDILRAIQSMTGNSNDAFVKIVTIIGLFVVVFRITSSGNADYMSIAKFLVMATFVVNMFWTQQREFVIRDKVNNFVSPAVLSIPPGIGYTFSFFSRLEEGVGEKFEAAFSTPNSISYQKAGLGFMMSAHLGMDTATIIKPELTQTFNAYLDNCLLNSALMNNQDLSYLLKSKDLYNDLAIDEAWLTPVYTSSGNPVMKQCLDAWSDIQIMLSGSQDQIISQFASSFGQISATDVTGKLGDVAKTLFNNTGTSAQAYINQMALLNMYNSGLQAVALSTGGSMSNIAVASAVRDASTQQSWLHTGLQAKKTLPLQKAFLTMISTVLLLLMALYSIALADFSGITQMFKLLITFSLWTPLAIVINYMTYTTIEAVTSGITANDLPSILTKVAISQETSGYLAFLGYAITLVTAMAFTIVMKSTQGFVQATMASMQGAGIQQATGIGAQGLVSTNNVTTGNRSFDNHSQNSNTMYSRSVDRAALSGVSMMEGGGGNLNYNNSLGTNQRVSDNGMVSATFKGDSAANVSMNGVNLGRMSESVGERVEQTKQALESASKSISVARAESLGHEFSSRTTQSSMERTAKERGLNSDEAQTVRKGYEESTRNAYDKAVDTLEKKGLVKSTNGRLYVDGHLGGDGKILGGKVGVSGEKSLSAFQNSEASESTKAAFESAYRQHLSREIDHRMSTSDAFRHSVEKSFGHDISSGQSASNSKNYTEAKSWQETQTQIESLNKFSAKSSESSTELNTAIAERIARAEKAYTQEQKMDLWNDVREHQIKGSDKYKNTIDNAVSDELKSRGVNISRPTEGQQSFTDPHELKDAIKKEASTIHKEATGISKTPNAGLMDDKKEMGELRGSFANNTTNLNPNPKTATQLQNSVLENKNSLFEASNDRLSTNPVSMGVMAGRETIGDFVDPVTKLGGQALTYMHNSTPQGNNNSEYMRSVVNGGADNTNIPSGRGGFEDLLGKKGDKTVVVQETTNPRAKVDTEAIRRARTESKERSKEK